jgi:hypothetical protein
LLDGLVDEVVFVSITFVQIILTSQ